MRSKCKLEIHCFPEIKSKDLCANTGDNVSKKFKQNKINEKVENIGKQAQPWPKQEIQDHDSEIEQLINQAHENGYAMGFEDGRIEEKKRVDNLANTVSEVVSNLEIYKSQLLEQAEESIIKIVLALARKIILKEPSVSKEVLLTVTQNALKMVVDPTNLKIKVNPEDLKILNESKNSLESIIGKGNTIIIESDAAISTGGCIVETDFGDIDARIEAQLKIMEKTLLSELNLIMLRKQGDSWK